MPTFRYSAYGARGEFAEGKIDAATHDLATQLLWAQGLTAFQMQPIGAAETPWWRRELSVRRGSSPRELAAFTREFATLMGADIPLDDALRILCERGASSAMTTIAKDLRGGVLNGLALSEAMQKQPGVFAPDYLSMIRAGEIGGHLGSMLGELADLLERRAEIRARMRSALVYPALLLVLATASLGVIIGVLVPSVVGIFDGSGRPLPTVLGLAMALHAHWLEIILGITVSGGLAGAAVHRAWTGPATRAQAERRLLQIPFVGALVLDQETGRFGRVLGTLLKAGVPLLSASLSARAIVHNGHLGRGIDRAIDRIREGAALHQALQQETMLPALALRMIAVGEEAGKLDVMLMRVAIMFEQKTQRTAERLMTVLTPLLTIVMACVVGGLVMAVIDAVMSINDLAFR
ncbi:MAG TPA: type II secretion system F family protein [Pseudolabrys sp.]|nr:type II secretion system F family protein [Pseudolabrys sp.]